MNPGSPFQSPCPVLKLVGRLRTNKQIENTQTNNAGFVGNLGERSTWVAGHLVGPLPGLCSLAPRRGGGLLSKNQRPTK